MSGGSILTQIAVAARWSAGAAALFAITASGREVSAQSRSGTGTGSGSSMFGSGSTGAGTGGSMGSAGTGSGSSMFGSARGATGAQSGAGGFGSGGFGQSGFGQNASGQTGANQQGGFIGRNNANGQQGNFIGRNTQQGTNLGGQGQAGVGNPGRNNGGGQRGLQDLQQLLNGNNGGNGAGNSANNRAAGVRPRQKIAFDYPQPAPPAVVAALNLRLEKLTARYSELSGVGLEPGASGEVVLTGSVSSEKAAKLAESLIRLEPGVKSVRNELSFPPPAPEAETP